MKKIKCSVRWIKEDVKQVKLKRPEYWVIQDLSDHAFFEDLRKEFDEKNRRRNFVQELLETDSKLASYISVIATDEKVVKKVHKFVKQKKHPEYIDVDIRDIMAEVSLKEHIEAVWNTRFNMNACKCCLPEHQDKTASFHIYPNTNSFFCFGCHAWGSMIDFLMHNDKMTKVQAINYIKSCTSQTHHHSRRSTGEQKLF